MASGRPPSIAVLLADDSAVARLALARRLRAEGFDVVEQVSAGAPNGAAGIVSCALLDLDLGDGDGAEVAEGLRAARADLPIAFFSAAATPDVVSRARAIGPVFTKPDQLDDAVAWVRANAKPR